MALLISGEMFKAPFLAVARMYEDQAAPLEEWTLGVNALRV
ncbi:hypothetical protein [Corynebacterium anserum]|nr:hypothetical protein [Corynebacterium anserum]